MRIMAVIPAYREAGRITATIEGIRPFIPDIVVVDDGSPDATFDAAQAAGVRVLRHAMNRGQGAALRTGTEAALRLGADVIVHMDADGQHDPAYIPALLEPIQAGRADVVFGSRFMGQEATGMPASRRALLHAARAFNALAVGVPRTVTDPQCGYRALTKAAASSLDFRQDGMAHCSEILRLVVRSPHPWCEVPVRVRYTADTLEKGQKTWDAARIAWQLFIGAFTR